MREGYKFKGWDWTEISDYYGIEQNDENDTEENPFASEEILAKETKERLLNEFRDNENETIEVCKEFLRAIIAEDEAQGAGDRLTMERALLSIENNNHLFMNWFVNNLTFFWT